MPNNECLKKSELLMVFRGIDVTVLPVAIRHSCFVILSSFVIRHSSLVIRHFFRSGWAQRRIELSGDRGWRG
jgi:hypothetical protein